MRVRGMVVVGVLPGPSEQGRLYLLWNSLDRLGDCQCLAGVWRFNMGEKLRLSRGQV